MRNKMEIDAELAMWLREAGVVLAHFIEDIDSPTARARGKELSRKFLAINSYAKEEDLEGLKKQVIDIWMNIERDTTNSHLPDAGRAATQAEIICHKMNWRYGRA